MSKISRRETLGGLSLGLTGAMMLPDAGLAKGRRALKAGAVATADTPSAEIGAQILEAGGNAVDSAVAIGFALAVSYPEAGNIGGGGFMTLVMQGKPYFLDYRETAPGKAKADMYLNARGDVRTGSTVIGNLAAGTPGTVAGLFAAHRRFGKLPWARVVAPAVRLARDGFAPPAQMIRIYQEAFAELGRDTNFGSYFGSMAEGKAFTQPDLANTLEAIAQRGPAAFYQGRVATQIIAQMNRGVEKGLISLSDLEAYRPVWRTALMSEWRGYDVVSAPPPSSGGIALLQLLGMKEARADLFAGVAHNSADYIHLLAELEKRVFADRAVYLGDPDFVQVPVAKLLAADYIKARAKGVQAEFPSPTDQIQPGLEKPQTTHYSVVDSDGNAVSNTYTLNGWYGSGVVVEGAGFLLNNEMDDFSAKPGVANQYGVVGGDANSIQPFKRPLSSMTPTILMKDGLPAMVLGSPGGSRIITTVFQVLLNALDYKMPLKAAVDAPRYHHQLVPENTIFTEPYAPASEDLKQELERRGYRIEAQNYNGDIAAIQVANGQPRIAPDPRARGAARITRS
ncbi:MAG: gamma-glutamyltransferase [Alphaproteobacteria bacterium PA1]|nr:MAG: gamma-glutamyltransferase [Alphaproteobacteria bacterium PA1]